MTSAVDSSPVAAAGAASRIAAPAAVSRSLARVFAGSPSPPARFHHRAPPVRDVLARTSTLRL
jgi:hypothetical protein